jgi:LPXTG-motif cell wall-anchored protein
MPTVTPMPSYFPTPSVAPAAPINNVNNNTNNNNSSATATANVIINPASTVAKGSYPASTAGYGDSGKGGPMMLPETGTNDPIIGLVGVGSLVAAGTAYAMSRRELTNMIFKRN